MSVGATQTALRRKLGAGRPPESVQAMTPGRAWRLALVHGFSESAGLDVTMKEHAVRPVDPPDFAGLMDAGDLAILLEGVNGFAVALLDVQLMAALIESQTMGRVLPRRSAPRPPTPTDGAMMADPLDRVLGLFETHGAGVEGAQTCRGMRFATLLGDGRAVTLALPDKTHLLTEIALTFGGGDRQGRLRLILPEKLPQVEPVPETDDAWQAGIEANILAAQAQLSAVLTRLHLPIEQVTGWEVGALLPLPSKALAQIALIGCTGTIMAQGRLGQSAGNKAVLLDSLPAPARQHALPGDDTATAQAGSLMTGKAPFGNRT